MENEKEKILYTKKTITQDPNDPEIQWVELDLKTNQFKRY